jgi:DNA-binding transcriptional LysR family regulator
MRGREFAELNALSMIVQQGSFTRAAARLAVTPSALSQSIRNLEERLGVRLLNRTTRSVAPSQAGARLLARLGPVLTELESALADVHGQGARPAGRVRVNSARIAAVHFLAPLLGRFRAAYPEVQLEIAVEDALADIVAQGFDAGIRLGERLEKDMVAVKVSGPLELMAVASPAYLARAGVPQTPRDLLSHRCINHRLPTGGGLWRWEFERAGKPLEIAVDGPLIVNDTELALRAALDGVGIVYLLDPHLPGLIDSGRLTRVLKAWSPSFPGFFLYYPRQRHTPPPLRALVDFLRRPPTKP